MRFTTTRSVGDQDVLPSVPKSHPPVPDNRQVWILFASILITASAASLLAVPLSYRISRARTISLGAMIFSAGSAIACSARSLSQLFVVRCIAGVGEGLFLSAITVYTVEIAPARSRGRLGTVVQLLITMGIASGASCSQSHDVATL